PISTSNTLLPPSPTILPYTTLFRSTIIGRSITLDGVAHTIVGVLPNQPAAWFGNNPVAEVWTTKPFILPGFSQERIMRGTGFLRDRKSTRLNSSHLGISYAVLCLKK